MADNEGFEDDLFADLYTDDDPAKSTSTPQIDSAQPNGVTAPAPAPVSSTSAPAPTQDPTFDNSNGDSVPPLDINAQDDEYEYEDDDDDIDITLGNTSTDAIAVANATTTAFPNQSNQQNDRASTPALSVQGSSKLGVANKEDGKMFIGGLNWETTDESLRDYFSQFGEVLECTVMRDNNTGRSRGFGFLTFKDAKTVNIVMVKEHFLDGKIIDPKRAIPRDEQEKTSKIFVGGVSQETTDQEFREYFAQFGRVVDATLMMDKDTGRPRGFGFVTFESEAGVENCINTPLEIHGKPIEVKKAQPRGNLREEEDASRRNKFRKMDDQGISGGNGSGPCAANPGGAMMGQMGGGSGGGMTPQVMAQYMQRMQQYFSMMQQQQMAMSRGMGQMNPAMYQNMQQQMMQMQQMQMAGRGQGGMNPAMMGQIMGQMGQMNNQMGQMNNQMNNQMNSQMNNQMNNGMMNNGGAGRGFNGGGGMPQGSFEQQNNGPMFNQQRRFNNGGPNQAVNNWNNNNNNGGGGGGGGGGGNSGTPEAYDDSMQQGGSSQGPNQAGRGGPSFRRMPGSQTPDPTNAPPANAPTGPKNAGKPGANYRGGGRGGGGGTGRGFHPYSR
ncbi:putative RNA-binding protein [Ceratocystis fimbriata CBS 114723]|uniref:Putative RNA-binding protein n=1 Tax=Ceratocystis fimbriata CBS 114723 TaxID=1035309 RepID=A0A2C5X0G8_9PEZI|nr:putative RNA-binding protein [Ceratocystis fimbriata CBS 114723]